MHERRSWEEKLDITGDPYDGLPVPEPKEEEEDIGEGLLADYKFVKKKIKKAIKMNQSVVDILLSELRREPSARMAEVVARLLEGVSNSSVQLLQTSKTVAEIHNLLKEDTPKDAIPNTTIQNAIIVGKLEDLFKLNAAQKAAALQAVNGEEEDPYGTD